MMNQFFNEYSHSEESLKERISTLLSSTGQVAEGQADPYCLLGFIDLTTLEGADTVKKVEALSQKAKFSLVDSKYPDAAAVCVYPSLVRPAVKILEGSGILVASVAGGFPSGQTSLRVKMEEIRFALDEGADEIDTVISRGKLLEGNEAEVFDELCAIREECGIKRLKIILETGELPSPAIIRKAAGLAILAGADFIKTSTGKIPTGATPSAFLVMLDTILEYHQKTGKAVGIKAAGGIRKPEDAMLYARLVQAVVGDQWLHKDYFRIGASSLADEMLKGRHPQGPRPGCGPA